MGETIEAIVLGIIQGLTEFLPVSSSGHLELAKFFLNDDSVAEQSMLMTVMLHGATALSTIIVFRKDILEILKGLFQFKWNEETKFSLKIIISMVPAAIIGLLFEEQLETLFDKQILLVGIMLIITGLLLFLADRAKITNKTVSYSNALLIGISQAIAILPGISRSGATISTSVLLGIDREKAARFSFLMVVPLILGKIAKDLLSGDVNFSAEVLLPMSAGFVAAFLTGLLACTWMIKLVKNSKLSYFAYYCFIVAIIAILFGLGML
ncbi:MAG: undecaprenyl-diphosphatase [Saprospiraceae bacterium]|jgi:undecaprenyl-diphosphatase